MRVLVHVEHSSDDELLARLKRGDRHALGLIYSRHAARVFAFLSRLSGDRQIAEDLFQETWLKLAQAASELSSASDLRAWLFTVGRNAFFSQARKLARVSALDAEPEPPALDLEPDAALSSNRELVRLERALARLSVIDREVLLLVGVEAMSHEDAARVLMLEPPAFRKRLSRARARLAALLAEDNPNHAAGGSSE
ncbi:MAG: RNA polymerase sigma factor [Myxococcota bacterium]